MTTLPNHANSNHIYHYSAHLLKYKYIMKKIFTLILVAMAISLGASAQETSLRDQLVGMYGGTCLGYASYSDPTANGVYYSNTYNSDIPAVLIFPGEEDNELIISNFFPKADGINLDDIYCTLTETSAYADYGIVAYLSVENDVLGSFTKGGVEYDLDLVEMDYSWGVYEPPYTFWVYSDGSIETNCYADLHYKQDFSGTVYDMYLDVRYAKLTRAGDLPYLKEDADLADSLLGLYGGNAQGYASYSDPTANGTFYTEEYNTDACPAVEITEGEEGNQIVMANFFPKVDGITLNDIHCSVYATDDYADYGIVGYLSVDDEVLGSFTKGGVEYNLDLVEMDYSWGVNEPPYIFWVYSDGSIETNCYADLHYKQDFSGIVYDMYLDVRYAKLTPVNSGVQGIAADMTTVNNAPVEYFSINGMRVNGNNLVPGLYIKRQGTQVTKVIVK